MRWSRRFWRTFNLFKQQYHRNSAQSQDAKQQKNIHKRPQMRLVVEGVVNRRIGHRRRGRRIVLLRQYVAGGGQPLDERRIGRG